MGSLMYVNKVPRALRRTLTQRKVEWNGPCNAAPRMMMATDPLRAISPPSASAHVTARIAPGSPR